jgi:regulation of enolase protein 1 (concanavalin A-like superfamily)
MTLLNFPGNLHWKNDPVDWKIESDNSLSITAGAGTNWFIDPAGSNRVASNGPAALFVPSVENFLLSAKVTVNFASTFDAGVLFLYESDNLWTKLCFEYSPQGKPMVVSVVTRGLSDDCNSVVIDGNSVYLRVARIATTFVLHYSLDGRYWNMVRYFTLGTVDNLQVGFLAQSPTGQGCNVVFSEIDYQPGILKDMRNGE